MAIVETYDRKSLFLKLLKFHQHLHPLSKVENSFDYKIDKDNNLDIFQMATNTNEVAKELVNENYCYFINIRWMQKISNAFWSGGRNMKLCFQLLVF
jgi:hypothetical protein